MKCWTAPPTPKFNLRLHRRWDGSGIRGHSAIYAPSSAIPGGATLRVPGHLWPLVASATWTAGRGSVGCPWTSSTTSPSPRYLSRSTKQAPGPALNQQGDANTKNPRRDSSHRNEPQNFHAVSKLLVALCD